MNSGELLSIEPSELKFSFELKKQISCSLQLSNKTGNHVAFKVKTTAQKNYCVRPNTGVVLPWSTCDIKVTMQAQKKAPTNMECNDKFLIQSVVASPDLKIQDINRAMFDEEAGHVVENKLKVVYVSLPQPPSTIQEQSENGSVSDNQNLNSSQCTSATSSFVTSHSFLSTLSTQSGALISKLKAMKINAFRHNGLLPKNSNNTSTTMQEDLEKPLLSEYGDKPASKKIMAIEAELKDANKKIQALEAALDDTKLVLKGLGKRIDDLSS